MALMWSPPGSFARLSCCRYW